MKEVLIDRVEDLQDTLKDILDYRLEEMGVSLEYYKEEKSKVKQDEYWEDYDDYDYIVECCLEVLEEDADNEQL